MNSRGKEFTSAALKMASRAMCYGSKFRPVACRTILPGRTLPWSIGAWRCNQTAAIKRMLHVKSPLLTQQYLSHPTVHRVAAYPQKRLVQGSKWLTWWSPLREAEPAGVKAEVEVGKARVEKAEVAAGAKMEVDWGPWGYWAACKGAGVA